MHKYVYFLKDACIIISKETSTLERVKCDLLPAQSNQTSNNCKIKNILILLKARMKFLLLPIRVNVVPLL